MLSTRSDFAVVNVIGKKVGTAIIVGTEGQQCAFGPVEEQVPLRIPVGELVEVRL